MVTSKRARRRRSQAQRREETRGAVLDATVECLATRGYAFTTTTRIARRARVSRGALLHYYPSKQDLLVAAIEHVFQRRTEEFRLAFASLPESADRGAAAVDLLWTMFRGPTFQAWLELVVAARNDRELLDRVAAVTTRFGETVEATYRDLFPITQAGPFYALVPRFVFALLQGLALELVAVPDAARLDDLLEALKSLAPLAFGSTPSVSAELGERRPS